MAKIAKITARQILDSRGTPTIETTVVLDNGLFAVASCPSGASTGAHEALELRDGDLKKYNGKSVLNAVANVNTTINAALSGKEATNNKDIDAVLLTLDTSPNKSTLGANAILSVSFALAKAIALSRAIPTYQYIHEQLTIKTPLFLPKPLCNLINGGMHASWNLDIQEFMVIPVETNSFSEAIHQAVLVMVCLKKMLIEKGFQPLVGDEGGFAPKLTTNKEALDILTEAIGTAGLVAGKEIMLGIDAAATSFFKDGMYNIRDLGKSVPSAELGTFYKELIEKYSLLYMEDLFAEDDIVGWASFTPTVPDGVIVTGDDLTCTNSKRLTMALEKKAIRGIIIKPNQIGTVTETIQVVEQAKAAGLTTIVSHRSGETTDDFIADFAVGVGADFAKFGAPVRGERVVKYNRLLQIEQELAISDKR